MVTHHFEAYAEELASKNFEDAVLLEAHAREFSNRKGIKFAEFAHPLRAIITGTTAGPKLFDFMRIIGKDATLLRLSQTPLKV